MPIWEITDLDGNSHSVDLSKTSINSIDDVKAEFKKFDQKKKRNSSRPSLKETQAMQARNRGGY
tara:strand:+ start:637 stop:828 length:192 start_codon:yes stop_codon:yes gene_type:complete